MNKQQAALQERLMFRAFLDFCVQTKQLTEEKARDTLRDFDEEMKQEMASTGKAS